MTRHLSEDVRREQILAAARSEFVERGFVATRMDDIATRAGLSKGGVYFHFAAKRDVFWELVENEYRLSMGILERVGMDDGTVASKLQILGQFYPVHYAEDPDAARFFLVMNAVALRDVEVRNRLIEMQNTYQQALQGVLEQGVKSGELRPMDVSMVALLLKAIMDGLEVAMAQGQNLDAERFLRSALEVLFRGMLSSSAGEPILKAG